MILNFGSLNIDKVYRVAHFVQPGETLAAERCDTFPGGKGLNQSIALARAGVPVCHAGMIGEDGFFLRDLLMKNHVDCSHLAVSPTVPSGHAIIQVSEEGENCILLFGGANQAITNQEIKKALDTLQPGDWVLLQNEISGIPAIIDAAAERGAKIFFNPAPMAPEVLNYPLKKLDTLIVNETEGAALAGVKTTGHEAVIASLRAKLPEVHLLMTLGARGAVYCARGNSDTVFAPACRVNKVVDTTAAGDTFIGYFMAELRQGKNPAEAMAMAAKASAWCVARAGAACSIPRREKLA